MIETEDYWISNDNKFIFKPNFNKNISTIYYDLIYNYNKLIFSDYNKLILSNCKN